MELPGYYQERKIRRFKKKHPKIFLLIEIDPQTIDFDDDGDPILGGSCCTHWGCTCGCDNNTTLDSQDLTISGLGNVKQTIIGADAAAALLKG